MKIGILTLPLHTNYGGILQAYALQTILERMGHEVVVFDTSKRISIPMWKYPFAFIKRFIRKFLLQKPTRLFYEKWYNDTYLIISQNTQRFINKYIHRLEISSFSSLHEDNFDALIVGSDQVWRPMYFCPMYSTKIENAFLAFAQKWSVRRIAYATSFGSEKWEYTSKETACCRCLIKKFDIISVREKLGVKMCKDKFDIEAIHVLDPTMLLNKEDYIEMIKAADDIKPSNGNLLCYILDETKEISEIISHIAAKKNLKPFYANSKVDNHEVDIKLRIQPAVESWLRGFYDAEFIVTDSFHACVFAILFQKPFVVIGNSDRGMARFYSLLELFGLQSCLVASAQDINNDEINWDEISTILRERRICSYQLLHKALT